MLKVSKGWLKKMIQPKKYSHKGDNGRLVIVAGSEQFHGAAILAVKVAARFVDVVYFASVPENNRLVQKLKSALAEVIVLQPEQITGAVAMADAVLIGPGTGYLKGYIRVKAKKRLTALKSKTEYWLKKFPDKKFILDADILRLINPRKLSSHCLVTPHCQEFSALFNCPANEANVKALAKKYGCVILLKGVKDIICSSTQCAYNTTGNAGLTKGGTGDVLAGLTAALACKHDLFLAGCLGAYINGLAGDSLFKRQSFYYRAGDLAEEIPRVLKP